MALLALIAIQCLFLPCIALVVVVAFLSLVMPSSPCEPFNALYQPFSALLYLFCFVALCEPSQAFFDSYVKNYSGPDQTLLLFDLKIVVSGILDL